MIPGEPSRTALGAARHRAAHQVLEGGAIFRDALAVRILAEDGAGIAADAAARPMRRPMRFFIAARHRIAEDAVARAVAAGLAQVVVLGAGLDTQAYRSPYGAAVTMYEVDHPATQGWKRARLAETGMECPAWLRFVPVDFETDNLGAALFGAGLAADRKAIFVWLGVVPYLTDAAIFGTLGMMAALPGGAEVIFDYADPPAVWPEALRPMHDQRAARVASIGEAWISYFEAEALAVRLRAMGFAGVEDFGPADIAGRFWPGKGAIARDRGGHVVRAWT